MIILIDIEKALEKSQHKLMMKILSKGMEVNFLLIKSMSKKPDNIILN